MKLDDLEITILKDIVRYQLRANGLNLERQLESLKVKKRELTGFGIYVHFESDTQADLTVQLGERNTYLSSPIKKESGSKTV